MKTAKLIQMKVKTDNKNAGRAQAARVIAAKVDTLIFTLQTALVNIGGEMPSSLDDTNAFFIAGQLSGLGASVKHVKDLRAAISVEFGEFKGPKK